MTATDTPLDVNAACTHPRACHRHGTYACYVLDKCRCAPCKAARAAAGKVQARNKLYADHGVERYAVYVDAAPAVEHLHALIAAGLGFKEIAKRAGVAGSAVGAMLWPTPSRNRGLRTRCTRDTLAKILAVPIPDLGDLAGGRKVDATRSRNRVRALVHIGYSLNELAAHGRMDHQRLRLVLSGDRATTADTHRRIQALFSDLWNKPNEPTEWRAKIAASRSRNWATREGWPMPIEINGGGYLADDAPVDDEDGDEFIDLVAVERVLAGDWARLTSPEVVEVIRRGAERGLSVAQMAVYLRMSKSAVSQRASREGISTHPGEVAA